MADIGAVTLMTPKGRGAVATVGVRSVHVVQHIARFFSPASGRLAERLNEKQIVFGDWRSANGTSEGVVVAAGQGDEIEIHCHGGIAAAESILKCLEQSGLRRLAWQEWIGDGIRDAIQVESIQALSRALTERCAAVLLDQYNGALNRNVAKILEQSRSRESSQAASLLEELIARYPVGAGLTQARQVVLGGPPNAGKSSLINRIVGYQRAIIFHEPGTTRDIVSTITAIDGWPIELSDTAGLRHGQSQIEAAGIELAVKKLDQADLIVLVFDATVPWSDHDQQYLDRWPEAFVIGNKVDLGYLPNDRFHLVTSAETGEAVDELLSLIAERLCPMPIAPGDPVPFTTRQQELLATAKNHLDKQNLGSCEAALRQLVN